MFRAVAIWHSPAVKPGEPDFFEAVDAAGSVQHIYTSKNSKRWIALAKNTIALAHRETVGQLSNVLHALSVGHEAQVLTGCDDPMLPSVRLSACTQSGEHIATVRLTPKEWAGIKRILGVQ